MPTERFLEIFPPGKSGTHPLGMNEAPAVEEIPHPAIHFEMEPLPFDKQ